MTGAWILGARASLLSISILMSAGSVSAGALPLSFSDFSGMADLRLSAANGERSWINNGFGKAGVNGGGDHFKPTGELAQSLLAWTPHMTWNFGAVIVGQYQPRGLRGPSLSEAYLTFKPTPWSDTHFSGRLGLLYPPISMEHEGVAWIDTDMISASAANTWVGEEVRVVAAEGKVSHNVRGLPVSATVAIFAFNDTSGTLLTTRGWALGDVLGGAPDRHKLPPLGAFMKRVQAPITTPVFNIDDRPGGYARLTWQTTDTTALEAFYYDNRGNLVGVDHLQWAWRTRFGNVGARWDVTPTTHVLLQGMTGNTSFGFAHPDIWVDTDFTAGYALVKQDIGEDTVSGRVDVFRTRNNAKPRFGDTNENGWAITADYRRRLSRNANLLFEVLHVSSNRPARATILNEPAQQDQTVVQTSLRLSF